MIELLKIQSELKAPKGQYNSFGKYKYRSAEDILEAVKPLLLKNDCTMTLSDELINIGDRYYVKATAKITSKDESVAVTALAREPEDKKGMDSSQITGTASSYARKYALNGLFLIDDTKDADTDEYAQQTGRTQVTKKLVSQKQLDILNDFIKTDKQISWVADNYNVAELNQLTMAQASEIIKIYNSKHGRK